MIEQEETLKELKRQRRQNVIISEDEEDDESTSFVRIPSRPASSATSDNDVQKAIALLQSKGLSISGPASVDQPSNTDRNRDLLAEPKTSKTKAPPSGLFQSFRGFFSMGEDDDDIQSVTSVARSINSEQGTSTGRRGKGKGKASKNMDNEIHEIVGQKVKSELCQFEKHLESTLTSVFDSERQERRNELREQRAELEKQISELTEEKTKSKIEFENLKRSISHKMLTGDTPDTKQYSYIKHVRIFRSGVLLDQYVTDATYDEDKSAYYQMQTNMGFVGTNEVNQITPKQFHSGCYIRVWDLCSAGPDRSPDIVPTINAGVYSIEVVFSKPLPKQIAMLVVADQPSLLTLGSGGETATSYMQ